MTKPTSLSRTNNRSDLIRRLPKLFGTARWFLRTAGFVLLGLFTWLQLRGVPFPDFLNQSNPSTVLKLTLVGFYFSFMIGMSIDISIQESVYVGAPGRSLISKSEYMHFGMLLLAAIGLLWLKDDVGYFAVGLSIFTVVVISQIRTIHRAVKPIIDYSRKVYNEENDNIGREQLR